MNYRIVREGERFLVPLLLVVSIALLAKGHSAPGGGFAGGLLAASAFALRALAREPSPKEHASAVAARVLVGIGLVAVVAAGAWAVVLGKPLLTVVKAGITLPAGIHLDSSFLFELGIYLVSCGAGLAIIKSMLRQS